MCGAKVLSNGMAKEVLEFGRDRFVNNNAFRRHADLASLFFVSVKVGFVIFRNRESLTLRKAPCTQWRAACSRSASLSTIALAFPPSSIKTGFKCFPAVAEMILPTLVLPVKLIFLTSGCETRLSMVLAASAGEWNSKFKHPSGRPASCRTSEIAQ